MEDNNIQDSCCNSKYASIRQMDKLDEMLGRRFPFYPRTVIQAVHDGRTGASLEAILAQYNNIYVQYQGTAGRTRNIVPKEMRRKGIIILYVDMQGNAITEKCVNDAPDTPEKRRRRWRCGSSYRPDPSAGLLLRCRRRR